MEYNLQVKNIVKNYPSFKLDNVSFDIPKGSIMGLIGVNGAGKSTTMKSILGLCRIDSGEIMIAQKKDEIGVVFDDCHFPQMLTATQINHIFQNIYPNWDSGIFFNYLTRFDIPLIKQIKDYSRGMKMKLSIAVAVSHHAKLLILDEPTSGLDPIVRNEILDLFLEFINDDECSILVSSHITGDLEKISDYITFLDKGKVLMSDSKDNMIYSHGVARASREQLSLLPEEYVISIRENAYHSEALVKDVEKLSKLYPELVIDRASLEDIMMLLVGSNSK